MEYLFYFIFSPADGDGVTNHGKLKIKTTTETEINARQAISFRGNFVFPKLIININMEKKSSEHGIGIKFPMQVPNYSISVSI